MFKSRLTGAQVIEHEGLYKLIYKGYTIFTSTRVNESIMLSISREDCERLLDQTAITYKKQA